MMTAKAMLAKKLVAGARTVPLASAGVGRPGDVPHAGASSAEIP